MAYKMLHGIKGDINILIVECTLPHTHCTLAVGPRARHLVLIGALLLSGTKDTNLRIANRNYTWTFGLL